MANTTTTDPAAQNQPPISLAYRHAFGIKVDVKNNVHYADETQILYPAGTNTILYSADQKQQRFFHGSEGADGITCLAVNSSKRYVAVAEKCSSGALVTVFDLVAIKKRKTLSSSLLQDCDATEFVSMAFSSESPPRFLLTQTGQSSMGNSTLIYWLWDKARPISFQKFIVRENPIRECSFNPNDPSIVCVIGDGIMKLFQVKDGKEGSGFRVMGIPTEKTNRTFVCHTWLTDEKMLVCTEGGDLFLFDSGNDTFVFLECSPSREAKDPKETSAKDDPKEALEKKKPKSATTCILSFPSGKSFITGGDDGFIRVFEKSEDPKEVYRLSKKIHLDGFSDVGVSSLALSPGEETLAVSTSTAQLYQMSLLSSDLLKAEEAPVFEPVLTLFHTGTIWGMDVCTRKPLVVTCGQDKSVRVWNYMEKACELCKLFNEEAYSVAFHPSGFHLVIGFSDKLRLMNLLMGDMRQYKDLPIKQCKECRFSNGGQYFAAVNNTTIQVYKTYTCELVANLRGHNNKVRSVAWTADDSMLVSTGSDGAVYEFNVLAEGRRVSDWVCKGTNFSCVIVYTDPSTGGNTMYVVGNDKMLTEVFGGQKASLVQAGAALGQIVLSNSAKTLFAAVDEQDAPAPIRCYRFPLDGYYTEFTCHSAPATRIRITFDDYFLFTCSQDGCLFIFDVRKKDRMVKRDKENALQPADEILVTKLFLEEKQTQLLELERQVEELSNQIEFQLRHRESYHKEEMAELEDKYSQEIEQERTKYELLREEKNDMEMEYEDHIKSVADGHQKQTQELEAGFQTKMMQKVREYQELAAERESVHQKWDSDHRKMMEAHNQKVEQMQRNHEEHQGQEKHRIDLIKEEKQLAERVHQETMRQLEQDTDREIEELKEEKEARLKAEKDDKVRLRGQSGIHKRNHEELKRQMMKREEELKQYQEETRKKQEKIDGLQRDRDHNQKEIKERDKMIGDKEQRIYDLKKQNQELEKFKFVLDYKIKELKSQIDPRNDSIVEMKKQIQSTDADLEDYHRKNKLLQVNIDQLTEKQKSLQNEIVTQRKKMTDCQTIIKRFKNDLHECVQFIQEPKQLRDSVTALYKRYVPIGIKKQELDSDIQREYNRQRDYLEKSVESLKRKLLQDTEIHRTDNMRVLQENVALIREINDLRREINYLKHERQQQRLNVSKLKASNLNSLKGNTAPPAIGNEVSPAVSQELETNKATLADLNRRIQQQTQLREAALTNMSAQSLGSPTSETGQVVDS